jgi:hypothetical protein
LNLLSLVLELVIVLSDLALIYVKFLLVRCVLEILDGDLHEAVAKQEDNREKPEDQGQADHTTD